MIGNSLRIQSLIAQRGILENQLFNNMFCMVQPIRHETSVSFNGKPKPEPEGILQNDIRFSIMNFVIGSRIKAINEEIKSLKRMNNQEHKIDYLA